MCTPPFCEPARRCLGCISLRKASILIIFLNALYGFMMVVVHVFIFREPSAVMSILESSTAATAGGVPAPAATAVVTTHKHNWYLQIVDLDLAWAHGILGFNDWYLCMMGLIYGVVIIAFSLFVLQTVATSGRAAAVISRWYMMFLHMELLLYVAVALIKSPLLCRIKHHFLTLMNEDCNVLRFMFFERALSRIIIGSLCCWVFSSFAYLLAWGDPSVDDANLAEDGEGVRRRGYPGEGFPQHALSAVAVSPQRGSFAPQGYADDRRYGQGNRASFDRGSFANSQVGDPVSVSPGYEPRFVNAPGALHNQNVGGAYPGRESFQSQGRFGGSQFVMPRASSSIQSNATEASQAERQMLIKPPIVIH